MEINASVKEVSEIVAEIAAANVEQASGIDEVGKAIAHMDDMTQQNAAMVEQSASAAESLSKQAHDLEQLISSFDVGASGAERIVQSERGQRPTPRQRGSLRTQEVATEDDGGWTEF